MRELRKGRRISSKIWDDRPRRAGTQQRDAPAASETQDWSAARRNSAGRPRQTRPTFLRNMGPPVALRTVSMSSRRAIQDFGGMTHIKHEHNSGNRCLQLAWRSRLAQCESDAHTTPEAWRGLRAPITYTLHPQTTHRHTRLTHKGCRPHPPAGRGRTRPTAGPHTRRAWTPSEHTPKLRTESLLTHCARARTPRNLGNASKDRSDLFLFLFTTD